MVKNARFGHNSSNGCYSKMGFAIVLSTTLVLERLPITMPAHPHFEYNICTTVPKSNTTKYQNERVVHQRTVNLDATACLSHLQVLDDILEGVVVVMPSRRRHVQHGVVQVSKLVDLSLERVLDAEEGLRDLLAQVSINFTTWEDFVRRKPKSMHSKRRSHRKPRPQKPQAMIDWRHDAELGYHRVGLDTISPGAARDFTMIPGVIAPRMIREPHPIVTPHCQPLGAGL